MKVFGFPDVTRVTVVADDGSVFERYRIWKGGVEIHLQDDGRTMKLFPLAEEPEDPTTQRGDIHA